MRLLTQLTVAHAQQWPGNRPPMRR